MGELEGNGAEGRVAIVVGETKEAGMRPREEVHAIREVRRSGFEWIRRMEGEGK